VFNELNNNNSPNAFADFVEAVLGQAKGFDNKPGLTMLSRYLINVLPRDRPADLGLCDADFIFPAYHHPDVRDPSLRYTDILVPYTTMTPFRVALSPSQARQLAALFVPRLSRLFWYKRAHTVLPALERQGSFFNFGARRTRYVYTAMIPYDSLQHAIVKFSSDWENFTPALVTKWCCSDGTRNLSTFDCQAMVMYFPRILDRIIRKRAALSNFL
jgi:hypothetical protein